MPSLSVHSTGGALDTHWIRLQLWDMLLQRFMGSRPPGSTPSFGSCTLLILEFRVPHVEDRSVPGALWPALKAVWSSFVAYIISFMAILIAPQDFEPAHRSTLCT